MQYDKYFKYVHTYIHTYIHTHIHTIAGELRLIHINVRFNAYRHILQRFQAELPVLLMRNNALFPINHKISIVYVCAHIHGKACV
jgi:hypothetical protein